MLYFFLLLGHSQFTPVGFRLSLNRWDTYPTKNGIVLRVLA